MIITIILYQEVNLRRLEYTYVCDERAYIFRKGKLLYKYNFITFGSKFTLSYNFTPQLFISLHRFPVLLVSRSAVKHSLREGVKKNH